MAPSGQCAALFSAVPGTKLFAMPSVSPAAGGTPGTLLVVGGRPDTVRKAAGLGLRVVLLQHQAHFAPETARLAEAVIIADYTRWTSIAPLVAAAHHVYGFTAAVSLTEPGLEIVGRVNDLLGLRGTSFETARLLKDKLAMRRHLAQASAAVAAASVPGAAAASEQDLRDFGERHGYPFVVKPADITASLGVRRVDGPEQVPAAWAAVEQLRSDSGLPWAEFFTVGPHIVEGYIEGPEYSVEAFSFDGRHVVVAVTEKLNPPGEFIELGHAMPARLAPADEAAVIAVTERFLDAVGLRDGASHTEVKLSPAGPVIIEGHNRIGGDRIVDLLELAYGIDFELLTVAWPFRLVEPLAGRPVPGCAAATQFLTAPAGVVTAVTGADQVREQPGVFALDVAVKPGDAVRAGSNWDRAGQVIVTAADTATALGLAAKLADQVQISITPPGSAQKGS